MKYLLLDTNIYIDMIVSRSSSNTADSYELLKMLLDHEKVKIILPAIIETEIKRYIESEINKIGSLVRSARTSIDEIYWINHVEEIKKYNEKIKPLKRTLGTMVDEFNLNKYRYINDANQKITELLHYENVIRIEESSSLLLNVQQRKLYKQCPFHIEGKESWADAIIIETLLNIKDFIEVKDDDQIYFITRNFKDFSKGKSKLEKEYIHPHIEEQLINNQLDQLFHYRLLYTKTLLEDFSEETKEADIYQSLMEEAEEVRKWMICGLSQDIYEAERESVGLTSLSSDEIFHDRISESDEVNELLTTVNSLLSSLSAEIDEVSDEYSKFVDDMNQKPLNDLIASIQSYNAQSPFLKICYEEEFTEEEVRDAILEFINDNLCPVEDLTLSLESITYKEYFDIGDLFVFNDLRGNIFTLLIEGQLDPQNDISDIISLVLKKNNEGISHGIIEVYYGYINFDEDGGPSNGAEESMNYQLENIISDFQELIQESLNTINKMRNDLNKMRTILSF